MKIKKLLSTFAALVIAASSFAGLGITANAANGDTLYDVDFDTKTDATTTWATTYSSVADLTDVTSLTAKYEHDISAKPSTVTGNALKAVGGGSGGRTTKITLGTAVAPTVSMNMTFDVYVSGATNVAHEIKLGDSTMVQSAGDVTGVFFGIGSREATARAKLAYLDPESLTWVSTGVSADVWCKVDLDVDFINKLVSFTIKSADEATTYATVENAALNTGATEWSTLLLDGYRTNSGYVDLVALMDNIVATDTSPEITLCEYTVKFVDEEDNEIKTAETRESALEATVEISILDKEAIYSEDGTKKYIYDEANSTTSATVEETGTELVVKFRTVEKQTFNVTANATVDETTVDLGIVATDVTGFEADTVTIPYSRYILQDSVVYMKDATSKEYKYSMVVAETQADVELEYSKYIEDVVYFSEAENIEGLTADNGGQGGTRSSNSYGAYAGTDTTITTLPAGKYTLETARCGNAGTTFTFTAGETVILETTTNGSWTAETSAEFTVTEDTDIILKAAGAGGSNSKLVDYVLIKKTGEAPPSIASVTSVTNAEVAPTADTINVAGKEETASYADLTDGKTITTIYVKVDNAANVDGVAPTVVVDINGTEETALATQYTSPNADGTFVYQIVADAEATIKSVTYGDYDTYKPADDSADADDSTDDTTTDSEGTEADA